MKARPPIKGRLEILPDTPIFKEINVTMKGSEKAPALFVCMKIYLYPITIPHKMPC